MIRFSKYLWLYFFISALVLIPGIFSLVTFGLVPSIDFTGGTSLEISFPSSVALDVIEENLQKNTIPVVAIEQSQNNNFLIRSKPIQDEKISAFLLDVAVAASSAPTIIRNESVGPILGAELLRKAMVAAGLAIGAILMYVAWAFKNIKYGVSAIIALVHDLFITLGIFSLLGQYMHIEVDTLFVTAFLTTMSFSVHDTIVVFDRIREILRRGDKKTFEEATDMALTQTIGRSLANSFTIIFMLLALVLMGGDTIRWFAVALLVGTISGSYSSPFVATPMLVLWNRWEKKRQEVN